MTNERLDELEAAYRASSQGSWYLWDGVELMCFETGQLLAIDWRELTEGDDPEDVIALLKSSIPTFIRGEDAQFVVMVHRHFPELLAEISHFRYALRLMIDKFGVDSPAGKYAREALETAERGECMI